MCPCKNWFCNRMDLRTTWLDTRAGNGWKMAVAAVSGLIAKENVVATFGIVIRFRRSSEMTSNSETFHMKSYGNQP